MFWRNIQVVWCKIWKCQSCAKVLRCLRYIKVLRCLRCVKALRCLKVKFKYAIDDVRGKPLVTQDLWRKTLGGEESHTALEFLIKKWFQVGI